MKRRLLWCFITIATLTIITFLALRQNAETVSAVSQPGKLEKNEQLHRAAFERNKTLRAEQRAQPADPSITDDVALGLMLRFITGNQNERQKAQVRQYMSDILGVKNRADQDKLFTVGETYKLQSNQIQMQSEATTLKYHPSHNAITASDGRALRQLAQDKENLIRNSKRTLEHNLSAPAWAAIEIALTTRIKPRIKAVRETGTGGE